MNCYVVVKIEFNESILKFGKYQKAIIKMIPNKKNSSNDVISQILLSK